MKNEIVVMQKYSEMDHAVEGTHHQIPPQRRHPGLAKRTEGRREATRSMSIVKDVRTVRVPTQNLGMIFCFVFHSSTILWRQSSYV